MKRFDKMKLGSVLTPKGYVTAWVKWFENGGELIILLPKLILKLVTESANFTDTVFEIAFAPFKVLWWGVMGMFFGLILPVVVLRGILNISK